MSLDKISPIWEKNHKVWDFVVVVKNGCFVDAVIAFVANEPVACNGRLQRAMCSVAAKGRLFAMGRVLFRCSKMMLYTSSPIFFKKNCYFSCEKNMNLELRWDLLVMWCCLYDTSSLFLLRKKLTWDFEEKMIL